MRPADYRFTEARQSRCPHHSSWQRSANGTRTALRIAIGIATVGRPDIIVETIAELYGQERQPDQILVCSPTAADVEGIERRHPQVILLQGPSGLSAQRNEIIRHAHGNDVVLFVDDDFVVCPGYLAAIESAFIENEEIVLATGRV